MKTPTDAQERLAIGKRLHEKEWPTVKAAAAELGRHEASLYAWQAEYRRSAGITSDDAASRKRARDAERHRLKREEKRAAKDAGMNGSNGKLTVMPSQDNSIQLRRIAELEDELHHAHDHIETLQKLLMTVGKALP